ncbi:lactate utilization protein C [Capsulimonas corticalis]|uniref:Lactate utilization protein C n=1 Tax=Capsulimonas corticalis TaxID=2219043 RepID=A0A402CV64_9BACT|nr:lactate utilization protein [Capsulimonas corticalis]BDI30321.1 lactate utilization protein C [Capsulimonas corticalis]
MERDQLFQRIADRLGRPMATTAPARAVRGVSETYANAPYGHDAGAVDRVTRFAAELDALGGHATIVETPAGASQALKDLLDTLAPNTIITWERKDFADFNIEWLWDDRHARSWVAENPKAEEASLRDAAERADIGLTLADAAIANTGTLMLWTTPQHARSVSLLPTAHIAIVRESQLVDRMGQALAKVTALAHGDVPSSVHFITGPSRSSDIENDLSIGVHGPAALYAILCRGC